MQITPNVLVPILITGALAFGGVIPFMGLPGILWMEAADPIAKMFWGERFTKAYAAAGSSVWTAAIYGTVLAPLAIAPSWWLVITVFRATPFWAKLLLVLIPIALWGVLVGLGMNYLVMKSYHPSAG